MTIRFAHDSAAQLSDDALRAAIADVEGERLSISDLLERTLSAVRNNPKTYRTEIARDTDPALFGWGVQTWRSWSDYPDWGDYDWYNAWTDESGTCHDLPLRFTSREAATTWAVLDGERSFRKRHAAWRARHEAAQPALELFAQRKALLVKHNLWTRPEDSMAPLIYPGGVGHEPTREGHFGEHGQGRTRVTHDSEMDDPVLEWWLDNHQLAKHRS